MIDYQGEKLKKYLKEKKISVQHLAEKLNVSRQTIYDYFKSANLQPDTVRNLLDKLNVNVNEIWTDETSLTIIHKAENLNPIDEDFVQVPLAETKSSAGYALRYNDQEYIEDLPKTHIPKQYDKGNFMVFEVDGDSMDDGTSRAIKHKDRILAQEIDVSDWKNITINRYPFIIVYDNSTIIKQIANYDRNNGNITCHSFNPTFKDFQINVDEVRQLFYAIKKVESDLTL